MRHKNLIKVIAFLMITVILTAGLIACGGAADVTSSVSGGGGTTIVDPPNDGGTNDSDSTIDEDINEDGSWYIGETKGKEFYASSYRSIYVPDLSPTPWGIKVSYNDTNRLDRLWKGMIDGWKKDGKRRLYIKTDQGDLFFDADYNIRWSEKPDTVLKYFQGGLIVTLLSGKGQSGRLPNNGNDYDARGGDEGGNGWVGLYYLGGLYTYAMSVQQAAQLNCTTINRFFGWDSRAHNSNWNLYKGRMEVLVMHKNITVNGETGTKHPWGNWQSTGYGLQVYMDAFDNGYANGNIHLYNLKGNTPERYMGTFAQYGGAHQLYKAGFRWMHDKTYDPNTFSETTTDTSGRLNKEWVNIRTNPFK